MEPVNSNNSSSSVIPSNPVASTETPPVGTTPPINSSLPSNNSVQSMQTGPVEKSNALLYIFIAILIMVLIGLMGLFFYNKLSATTSTENKIVVPTTEPMATPTVVIPTYTSGEEKDAMGVEVGGADSQLNIIEQDINKL